MLLLFISFLTAEKLKNVYSTCLEMRLTETQSGVLATLVCMVTYNYPIIILNVNIISLVNKEIQYFDTATFSCQVKGSHLMEKKEDRTKINK